MSRREAWLSVGAVFALALAVRAIAAAAVGYAVPEDTAYYVGAGRNLLEGRGLVSDALWSYQTQPLTVPRAAFEVWLPLPTFLAAVPMAVFGTSFRSAQIVAILAGALVAALSWRLGADVATELGLPPGRARTLAIGSGVVAGVLATLVAHSSLPDSTMPFAALSLAACLLMTRLSAAPPAPPARHVARDARLLALGVVLGLSALCRSEAIWLALAWLVVAMAWTPGTRSLRLTLVAVPAVVAVLVFLPWAVRDWLVFGTPLPGQAIANALYVSNWDVFAYADPPTLARYLAQGLGALVTTRAEAIAHNLFDVLVVPGMPTGLLGLVALPWVVRLRAVRPLVIVSAAVFLASSLLFPVSTIWGTFLHAAGAIQALLVVSALVGLDALIAWIGRRRGWTRPVAWLGPALGAATAVPLLVVAISALGASARDVEARYTALPAALAAAGAPLGDRPVITDHPIWLADIAHVPALALPDEPPADVLKLARDFGARLVVVQGDVERAWPDVLDTSVPGAACFEPLRLADTSGSATSGGDGSPLVQTRVFLVVCR